jgi:hypothetical protein
VWGGALRLLCPGDCRVEQLRSRIRVEAAGSSSSARAAWNPFTTGILRSIRTSYPSRRAVLRRHDTGHEGGHRCNGSKRYWPSLAPIITASFLGPRLPS